MWGIKAHSRQFPLGAARVVVMMAAALFSAAPFPAFAQNAPQQLQQLFGNLIGAAIQQAQIVEDAKQSWGGVDQRVQACLVRTYNLSPAQLARKGVRADDPRLSQYLQSCQQSVWQQQESGIAQQDSNQSQQYPQRSPPPYKSDQLWLGAVTVDLSEEIARKHGMSAPTGAFVIRVSPGGPADQGAIRPGDIIVQVNGSDVTSSASLTAILRRIPQGRGVAIAAIHDNNSNRVRETLAWAEYGAVLPASPPVPVAPSVPELPPQDAVQNQEPPPVAQSWYVVRATASEAGSGTEDALLAAAKNKMETVCAGDYSLTKYHRFNGKGRDASINGLREPWLDAEAACAAERTVAPEAAASSLAIDDLIQNARIDAAKAMPNAEYFDLHSRAFDAGYDAVLDAVTAALIERGARIALSDTAKGMIVTEYPAKWGTPRAEQFFIVIDPESAARTRVTFKLISYWGDDVSPGVAGHHIDDNEAVRRRAEEFIAAVQRVIAR